MHVCAFNKFGFRYRQCKIISHDIIFYFFIDFDHAQPNKSVNCSTNFQPNQDNQKEPPPLPPKPRIVPIKPANWNSKPYLSNTSSFV